MLHTCARNYDPDSFQAMRRYLHANWLALTCVACCTWLPNLTPLRVIETKHFQRPCTIKIQFSMYLRSPRQRSTAHCCCCVLPLSVGATLSRHGRCFFFGGGTSRGGVTVRQRAAIVTAVVGGAANASYAENACACARDVFCSLNQMENVCLI